MKKRVLSALLLVCAVAVTGCGANTNTVSESTTSGEVTSNEEAAQEDAVQEESDNSEDDDANVVERVAFSEADEFKKSTEEAEPTVLAIYEAEDAILSDEITVESNLDGFSGTGFAHVSTSNFEITFDIEIAEEGQYMLGFNSAGIGGYKENFVSVDGNSVGNLVSEEAGVWGESTIAGVYLTAGEHQVVITPSWAWFDLDYMTIMTDAGINENVYNVSAETVNPNATKEAKAVKAYLAEQYGEKVISGQVCDYGIDGTEYQYIHDTTGKYPAILGLDFMNYSGYAKANNASAFSVNVATKYWEENGGIVTFCWHWFAPSKFHKQGQWYKTFSSENVEMDLAAIMNGEDEESYNLLMEDIDGIAAEIAKLQDAGVPILFRPLHEASGGWFWWGNYGADAYKKLYITIFERLTYEHGLNNIIWLWNGQDSEWYPGDEYVDIVGTDIYEKGNDYSSRVNYFADCIDASDEYNRIICQSECGTLSDIDMMFRDGAKWSYWCTWCGEFANDEKYTSKEELSKIYNDERVITLEDLPDFKN